MLQEWIRQTHNLTNLDINEYIELHSFEFIQIQSFGQKEAQFLKILTNKLDIFLTEKNIYTRS